jgi:TetR/AcrR family tetracycline transcriptional repressor
MGLSKQDIARAGLKLLNEVGLNGLTLRLIADELGVKAPALYWHMKNKQELLDEMATQMYRDSVRGMPADDWPTMLADGARALRRMMLNYRDGAKVFSGTFFTDDEPPSVVPLKLMTDAGLDPTRASIDPARAIQALFTVYSYTIGFTIEEQAVYPKPGERDERYVFENGEPSFEDGLTIVMLGIEAWLKS